MYRILCLTMEDLTIGKHNLLESYKLIENLVNNELYKVKKVRKNSQVFIIEMIKPQKDVLDLEKEKNILN